MMKQLLIFILVLPAISAASSYAQPCNQNSDCVSPLICDLASGKCTQPPSLICELFPSEWEYVYQPSVPYLPQKNITKMITALEEGNRTKGSAIGQTSGIYQAGWFSDWKVSALTGVMIAILLIAIAAMVGYAFNLNEIKAFVDIELGQAFVSAILVLSIIGVIIFLDQISSAVVASSNLPIVCSGAEPCYITAAKTYLDSIYKIGSTYAQDALKKSIKEQKAANLGVNTVANIALMAYAGVIIRPNAGRSIEAERAGIIFENATRMLASIYAQRYFIDVVAFALAPILLLLGILLRTFFFSRRLGGLLLAIGISIFVVYPLTYAFAWYTLQISVYGERVGQDSENCPAECKLSPPVAFYINNTTGGLILFKTKEDLKRAGINATNWATGDINGDGKAEFPGLVACEELDGIQNDCSGCPQECREVPFPRNKPKCDPVACAQCNPGCKVMRIRTDCASKCPTSLCQEGCKASIPFENKCYVKSDGNAVAAKLTVDCTVCKDCPNWCLLKKVNPDGSVELVRKDEKLCKEAPNDACNRCPLECSYVSKIGETFDCESPSVCGSCPKPCRVNWSSQLDKYDIQNFMQNYCSNNQQIREACSKCPMECRIQIPSNPLFDETPACYPYPQKNYISTNCTDCPEMCRFNDYSFITEYSAVEREGGIPVECAAEGVNCSASACQNQCRPQKFPPTCRISNMFDRQAEYCRNCPEEVRILLLHKNSSGDIDYFGPPAFNSNFYAERNGETIDCSSCSDACKRVIQVPNSQTNPECQDYDFASGEMGQCRKCPIECRIKFEGTDKYGYSRSGLLALWCSSLGCASENCSDSCKVKIPPATGLVCSEYLGNRDLIGEWGCYNTSNYFSSGECGGASSEEDCRSRGTECEWLNKGSVRIPIGQREYPFNEIDSCKQCPENWRIKDMEIKTLQVDCSLAACPNECRVDIPLKRSGGPQECRSYIPTSLPYFDCPVLCRRLNQDPMPEIYCNYVSCSSQQQSCALSPVPARICDGCFDCPYDCLYEPPLRTDCAEVCSQEDLTSEAASVDELLLSLPGSATGAVDVRNIGVLMIPAVVLPLFSIVMIISFVRVLSSTLGGDIDIPGLSRII